MSSQNSKKAVSLFPFPLVNHNIEGLNARHHRRSSIIYRTILVSLFVALVSLPFINLDVTSRSRGMIRSATETNQLTTVVGGMVMYAHLAENTSVCTGDTLLVLGSQEMDVRSQTLGDKIKKTQQLLTDVNTLLLVTKALEHKYPALGTALYQKDYASYRQEIDQYYLQLAHAERQYDRNNQLFAAGSISKMEQEQSRFDFNLAHETIEKIHLQKRQLWSQEANRYRRDILELRGELRQIGERSRQYVVTAPIDGTINQSAGLQQGNFVNPGQTIATLAPDDQLQVEVFVPSSDIGLVQQGMEVQLQIDAFHHNRWGMASGKVMAIASDIIEMNDQAVFVVKCTINEQQLELKNGYVGKFKPGMGLVAHFTLTKRSLFDLLHDKLDDWLDPTVAPLASH